VVGLDLGPALREVARATGARAGLGDRVELVEGNALALPFPDRSFDGVTAGFSLRNVADLDRALAEMLRVLRPGGFAVSLDVSKPTHPWVRAAFLLFFYHLVPWIGALGGRGRRPYAWLSESLRAFPDRESLSRRFAAAGFARVQDRALSFGAAALHRAWRPGP
jgi:demethylmenaquinone methyltransferase/2-methoxy-6-polyprenyl-1,4-benzoquinol methylase